MHSSASTCKIHTSSEEHRRNKKSAELWSNQSKGANMRRWAYHKCKHSKYKTHVMIAPSQDLPKCVSSKICVPTEIQSTWDKWRAVKEDMERNIRVSTENKLPTTTYHYKYRQAQTQGRIIKGAQTYKHKTNKERQRNGHANMKQTQTRNKKQQL